MEGFITKRGSIVHNWKVRWLCLHEDKAAKTLELRYYKDRNKLQMKGKYVLDTTSFIQICDNMNNQKNLLMINNSNSTSLIFSSESAAVRDEWLRYLKAAIETVQSFASQHTSDAVTMTPAVNNIHKSNLAASTAPSSGSTPVSASATTTSENRSVRPASPNPEAAGNSSVPNARARNATARSVAAGGAGSRQPSRIAARLNTMQSDSSKVSAATGVTKQLDSVAIDTDCKTVATASVETSETVADSTASGMDRKHRSAPSARTPQDAYAPSVETQNLSADAAAAVAAIRRKNKLDHGCRPSEIGDPVPKNDSDSDSDAADADLADGWMMAYTDSGDVYYYHKVSRITRWDKPEKHIMKAMNQRMEEVDKVCEETTHARRVELERQKEQQEKQLKVKEENQRTIDESLRKWVNGGKNGRELSFPELLRDLVLILPADLLLQLYETPSHKAAFDHLQTLTISSEPVEVKKAYMKAVRCIHPDKLPAGLSSCSKIMAEQVFIRCAEKYDLYRGAHDL